MSEDPMERRRRLQNDMARKAILVAARSRYTNSQGRISAEGAKQARIDAGLDPAPVPPNPQVRLARLEAGERHGLTLDQINAMSSTDDAEIELEARSLAPPGDGGTRGHAPEPPAPLDEAIRDAETAGDINRSMALKAQKLHQISADKAARNHPNAPR